MSAGVIDASTPTHLVAEAGDRYALCGVKDPLPVVLARYADRHVRGHGMVVCAGCAERQASADKGA